MNVSLSGRQRSLDDWLQEHGDDIVAIRRAIHANPELSGQEQATTELVSERLRLAGLEPRVLRSGTGLVCDIDVESSAQTPRLAFRAELDALAMDDEKDVDYRSKVPGVAHGCGHDVHTAVMLGTALYFARHRDRLPGPVRFIFQPAEEIVPGGAVAAIADGALAGVEAIFGIHCDPKLDTGRIAMIEGPISSAADMASIRLSGPGGHTARPERTVDLIAVAARVIAELPGRLAARLEDGASVKLTFGMVRAGDAANVIPTQCLLRASVRTPSMEVWERLPGTVRDALAETVAGTGAGHALEYVHGVPPVVNHPAITEIVRAAAIDELGPGTVTPARQSWGGDDFAWYGREVPATFVRLGVHDPMLGGQVLDLHSGAFDADESAIPLAVRLVVAATAEFHRRMQA